MKKNSLTLLLPGMIIMLSGCTVGRKLSFENLQAGPGLTPKKPADIVFQDKRPDVVSGKSKPSLCGHLKSTVQISYNIQTDKDKPLADEFAQSVCASYTKAGATGTTFTAGVGTSREALIAAFKKDDKDRLLLFTIKEWDARGVPKFSTIRYEVVCEFVLQVYDKSGVLLASDSTHDSMVKEQGAAVAVRQLQAMADEELDKQITILFNKEAIKNSL